MPINTQKVAALALRIAQQVQARAGKGVEAATVFLAARLRETVSTPAPRKRVVNSRGDIRYVATVRAVAGAPPRKLSGKLRQSITHTVKLPSGTQAMGGTKGRKRGVFGVVGVKARGANNFNYPKVLEQGDHKFLAPTVARYRSDLETIMGAHLRMRVVL